jgi:hypothetical protein
VANGIDWFRWHHGSVTDPKFGLVARRARVGLPTVVAIWAFLLEQASCAEVRGSIGGIDADSIDCMFGLEDGDCARVLEQMQARGLLEQGQICAWEKRQPKREDETANDRKRRQREREHELKLSSVTSGESRNVTQGHAEVTAGHAREEKRREEEPKTKTARKRSAPAVLVSLPDLIAEGCDEQSATDWLIARKAKGLPLTPTAWADTKAEAIKAGLSPAQAVKAAAGNGWAGFKASWKAQEASPRNAGPPATVPMGPNPADGFLAGLDERTATMTKPPAHLLALARKAVMHD